MEKEKYSILDEQSKITIDQLHKTVLNISSQCFEIKKICIITLTTISTLIKAFIKNPSTFEIILFCFFITILFFIVDAFMYYYQKSLRRLMILEENKIYERHDIEKQNFRKEGDKPDIFYSFFNKSQTLYYILILIFIVFMIKILYFENIKFIF